MVLEAKLAGATHGYHVCSLDIILEVREKSKASCKEEAIECLDELG